MEVYCGEYPANGYSIPYIIEIGWNHLYVKCGEREVEVKAITDADSDILWKVNKKSVRYKSPNQLVRLFERDNAYANVVFRKFIIEG